MIDISNGRKSRTDFQDLMPHRVHEILLVASPYDAYILEEDGQLTEQILTEYLGMNFSYAPRMNRVSTGFDAMESMKKKKFDLVIVMLRIEDQDPISLGTAIKDKYPRKPVILLAFDETELKQLPATISPKAIDRVFIWSGDASVFPAIIKFTEDRQNAKLDILRGNVRAILVIEDSPRMYSVLLPLIYREIMYQTKNLVNKSLNHAQRLLHLRGRPKVLLTVNYETAEKFIKRYGRNVIGVISDIRFPRNGKKDPEAGFRFIRWVRTIEPSMPVMLQSSDKTNSPLAEELKAQFLYKRSKTMLNDLRSFIIRNFGFGDFVFRLPDDTEVMKAANMTEFIQSIEQVPEESLLYHAQYNHFSNWLAARTEFAIASKLRPMDVRDYKTGEHLRKLLLDHLRSPDAKQGSGLIVDYSAGRKRKYQSSFSRLCGGSLGGKARGLAFARNMLEQSDIQAEFESLEIDIPKTAVIGTDEYDRFMKDNGLWEKALYAPDDQELEMLFLDARFSLDIMLKLESYLQENTSPLAVRSSSLLEDSQYQPLAGTYATFMLPNNQPTVKERLHLLLKTIKRIYASTFKGDARTLLENTAHRIEEEKMAVIIMEIAGQEYSSGRYYPTISGVLKSINYYPVSYMTRDEGVAYLALGFGKTIVDGGKCLRISPKYPNIQPQFYSTRSTLQSSQNQFYGLDLNATIEENNSRDLIPYNLKEAEQDGALKWVGSVLSSEDNTLRDSLNKAGTRIVSCAPILKMNLIPLADILNRLLALGKASLGCPIEIEFAVNLYQDRNRKPVFSLLQIKPMVLTGLKSIQVKDIASAQNFCTSSISLGDGIFDNIYDILYVRPDTFDPGRTQEIAQEVDTLNSSFENNRHYILGGPGRWGSADPWLGIPVNWRQISEARIIIEIGREELPIDLSFGSHFFQNITSLHIGYITIDPKNEMDILDETWLQEQPKKTQGQFVDHYSFDRPLVTFLDGLTGKGTIQKPLPEPELQMDEEESSGI